MLVTRKQVGWMGLFLLAGMLSGICQAQNFGLGINPGRMEVEINPGQEKTVNFVVESPPSDKVVRGRLQLSLTDWNIDQDAKLFYTAPGASQDSASPWIVFSPNAFAIASGQEQLVRVTIRVPANAKPGTYRTGVFVQERPPNMAPKLGKPEVYFRFRYVFMLYVLVPPVSGHGELVEVRMQPDKTGAMQLICEMKNSGSRHLRPLVTWKVSNSENVEIRSVKNEESSVLLPSAVLKQPFEIGEPLVPGKYEFYVMANFQDGSPVQAIKRVIEVPSSISPQNNLKNLNEAPISPSPQKSKVGTSPSR